MPHWHQSDPGEQYPCLWQLAGASEASPDHHCGRICRTTKPGTGGSCMSDGSEELHVSGMSWTAAHSRCPVLVAGGSGHLDLPQTSICIHQHSSRWTSWQARGLRSGWVKGPSWYLGGSCIRCCLWAKCVSAACLVKQAGPTGKLRTHGTAQSTGVQLGALGGQRGHAGAQVTCECAHAYER